MILHNNIRLLRKQHRLSQIELAAKLNLNRSNVASYEIGTNPPIDVLMRMADLFNVSIDMLVTTDLEELRKEQGASPIYDSISVQDVCSRIEQLIALVGKDVNSLASVAGIEVPKLKKLLKLKNSDDLLLLCKILSTYSWLNANWLMKGGAEHPIRLDESPEQQIPDAAENEKHYRTGLEKTIKDLMNRLDQLEKKSS